MKIYYANINDFEDIFFENALKAIPKEKLESINRFKNERAKKESILGWYLFSLGAKEYSLERYDLIFAEKGKPHLKNSPVQFNISHSDGFVCCVFANGEIGIDVEQKKSASDGVVKRVLCENEKVLFENSEDKEETFIHFWTLKESALKQSGDGITAGFLSLDFSEFLNSDFFEVNGKFYYSAFIKDYRISACADSGFDISLTEFKI